MSGRLFESSEIPCPTGERLHALVMRPPGPALRLVYLVPLVGASASQQILLFKSMTKRGSVLVSFEYRGHGASTGTFSVEKSLEDSLTSLSWAQDLAGSIGIPLHVVSNCYGSLAMLSWFRGTGPARLPLSLGAVSGLIDMHQIIRIDDFLPHVARACPFPVPTAGAFMELAGRGAIDLTGDCYRGALRGYLTGLFPELRVTDRSFEELSYDRVDMDATVRQFFDRAPLEGVAVPREVPCLFYYGLQDEIMGLDLPGGRRNYEKRVRTLVHHAQIRPANVDHFGRGMDRDLIVQQLVDFQEQQERQAAAR